MKDPENKLKRIDIGMKLFNLTKCFRGWGVRKIPGLGRIADYINKKYFDFNRVVLTKVLGSKMYVDGRDKSISGHLIWRGVYEDRSTEIFKDKVRPGMNIVDIGANIGLYTLLAARKMKNTGTIFAFEPEPENYRLLSANIRINGYTNVVAIQKGVSNKTGKQKLFKDGIDHGRHSLSERTNLKRAGAVEIETVTLDEFIKNTGNPRVDILKMDIEGAEGLVIEGADSVLKNNKLVLFMELFPNALRHLGSDPVVLLKKLENYGLKIKIIIDEVDNCVRNESLEYIINLCSTRKIGEAVNIIMEK